MIESARNVRAIERYTESKPKGKQPRQNKEQDSIAGPVLFAVGELKKRAEGADTFKPRDKKMTYESFYDFRNLRCQMNPAVVVGIDYRSFLV